MVQSIFLVCKHLVVGGLYPFWAGAQTNQDRIECRRMGLCKKWTLMIMHGDADLYLGTEKMPQQEFRIQTSALPAAHVHFYIPRLASTHQLKRKYCIRYPFWDGECETCRLQKRTFTWPLLSAVASTVYLENECFLTNQHLGQIWQNQLSLDFRSSKHVTLVAGAISPFARTTARTCPKSESRQIYLRKNWQQESCISEEFPLHRMV